MQGSWIPSKQATGQLPNQPSITLTKGSEAKVDILAKLNHSVYKTQSCVVKTVTYKF